MAYKLKILLVEDDSITLIFTRRLLEGLGWTVTTADCGATAITLAQADSFDLILMDLGLPDMDGFEVTRQIRLLPPPHNKPPIIALTAHTDANTQNQAIAAGMDDFVSKPLDIEKSEKVLKKFSSSISNK